MVLGSFSNLKYLGKLLQCRCVEMHCCTGLYFFLREMKLIPTSLEVNNAISGAVKIVLNLWAYGPSNAVNIKHVWMLCVSLYVHYSSHRRLVL